MISCTAFLNEEQDQDCFDYKPQGVRGTKRLDSLYSTCKDITTGPEFVQ